MANDMDDASSALIAKLLMQDQLGADYDPELFGKIGDEDDEYAPAAGSRRKRSSGAAPAKRGRKSTEAAKPTPPAGGDPEIELAKPAGEAAEQKGESAVGTGFYTEEEEKRFLEGLNLYGRDWGRLSAHVATRDRNSVRSHAQKYFLRLYRDGLPLPPKVVESGEGYTLSGKPLDPESAAARPYLQASAPRNTAAQEGAGAASSASTAAAAAGAAGAAEGEAKTEGKTAKKRREKPYVVTCPSSICPSPPSSSHYDWSLSVPHIFSARAPSPPPAPPAPTSEVAVLGRTRYAKDRLRQNTSISVQHLREMTNRYAQEHNPTVHTPTYVY